ncbi:AEC family transporter [Limobrevibacterium gyesilva]|uniref:AEC family transporter n=1 Tax=Limobrevibacterium gyesilva TaxID=2991712 RepID=A0AA41YJU7_9PROT|nr:AEC family transporter [Limobrevibacterium gyesilva]
MTDLFGIIAPVFALIGMGVAAVQMRLLETPAVRGMTDFVFFAAMPSLLFGSVAGAPPLRLLDVAGSFLGGAVLLFAAAVLLARYVLGVRLAQASMFGLNSVFGNTVMLGIPIVDAAYGREGVANLLAVIAFHSAVLLPLATIMIEADTDSGRGPLGVLQAAVPGIVRNPVVVSIMLAFVWRATGLSIPVPIGRLLGLMGAAGPPLALFCLGASLPRPTGWSDILEVSLAAVLKLAAMPALVALLAHLAGVTGVAFAVVVLASGLPTGANAFLLARRFATMAEASASTVVVSTVASLFTLAALLSWLR